MKITQIAELVNTSIKEATGLESVVLEDLSNVVDVGNEIMDSENVDPVIKKLVDHIGKVVVVDRVYKGGAPKVLMDSWEYGAVLEKINIEFPPVATDTEDWKLQNGTSYDQNIYTAPKASVKFYSDKVTFTVPISITERQFKCAFSSANQLNAFVSALYTSIENALTVSMDKLIMQTICNFIAEVLHNEYPTQDYSTKTGRMAINVLKKYNDTFPEKALTKANYRYSADFQQFVIAETDNIVKKLQSMTTLYNIGAKERFTPKDMLHCVFLSEFQNNIPKYLLAEKYNEGYLSLPKFETVNFWQGTGKDYSYESCSSIHVKNGEKDIVASDILAVLFDNNALGVSNLDRRVKSHKNERAEFTNYWYKNDAGFFNDFNEQFVVLFAA